MGTEPPTDDGGEQRQDELLATAQELAGAEDAGGRPRMRRGRARRRGRTISEDGAGELHEPAGVSSTADEDDQPDIPREVAETREMLDASGAVLPAEESAPRPPLTARAVDGGALLADAVRSYLDGLDSRGAGDPVTEDRLDRLRRTLEQYDDAT